MLTELLHSPSITEYMLSMRRYLLLFITLTYVCSHVSAQDIRLTDVQLWLKAGAKIDITEKLRFGFEEQIRFDNDIADLKNFHTEFDLRYKLNDHVYLHAVGRYTTNNDNSGENQGFEDRFRYQLGGSYLHRTGQWRFKHRLLYQNRNDLELTKAQGDVNEQFFRIRSNVEYKIKDWKYDPQFRIEYFGALNAEDAETVDQTRIGFGTEREYDGIGEFGFFFLMDFTKERDISFVDQIFFLKYTYSF